jgi:hypothetical protein
MNQTYWFEGLFGQTRGRISVTRKGERCTRACRVATRTQEPPAVPSHAAAGGWDPIGIALRMPGWVRPCRRFGFGEWSGRRNRRRREQCVVVCTLSGGNGFPLAADDWTEGSPRSWIEWPLATTMNANHKHLR